MRPSSSRSEEGERGFGALVVADLDGHTPVPRTATEGENLQPPTHGEALLTAARLSVGRLTRIGATLGLGDLELIRVEATEETTFVAHRGPEVMLGTDRGRAIRRTEAQVEAWLKEPPRETGASTRVPSSPSAPAESSPESFLPAPGRIDSEVPARAESERPDPASRSPRSVGFREPSGASEGTPSPDEGAARSGRQPSDQTRAASESTPPPDEGAARPLRAPSGTHLGQPSGEPRAASESTPSPNEGKPTAASEGTGESPLGGPPSISDETSQSAINGDITEFGIMELLEFLRQTHRSGLLACRGPTHQAILHLKEGGLISAVLVERSIEVGLDALELPPPDISLELRRQGIVEILIEIVHWEEGDFWFAPSVTKSSASTAQAFDTQRMLLEAFRRIDERDASNYS
ncbi:MAG: DUF4388 domain-containing protein [Myxococcota bacterium]